MSPRARKQLPAAKQTIALIDIGSGSVGAALAQIGGGENPMMLALKRTPLRLGAHRGAEQLQAQMLRGVREALASLHAYARSRKLGHAAIFLPAPWSALELTAVRFSQDKAFLADKKLLQRLVAQQVRKEEAQGTALESPDAEAGFLDAEQFVFERAVAGVRINGYSAPALPGGAEVFTVELMLAAASAPLALLAHVEALAGEFFPTVTLHSSALGAAHALSRLLADAGSARGEPEPFLLCDGEGEIAELMVLRGTIPEAHGTIPVGYSTIVRTLAAHGGFAHEEIPSALALIEHPHSPLAEASKEAVVLAKKECAEALGKAESLCAASMPKRCFIIGDGREAAWFAEALAQSPRLTAVLPKDFAVQILTAKSIADHVAYPAPRSKGDVMLGLQALFAADRFANPEVQKFYAI